MSSARVTPAARSAASRGVAGSLQRGERSRSGTALVVAGVLAAAVWSVVVMMDLPALMNELQWLFGAPVLPATYLGLRQGLPAATGGNVVAVEPGGRGQPASARQYRQFRVSDGNGHSWDLFFRDEDGGLNRVLLALHLARLPQVGEQVRIRGYPEHPETSKLSLISGANWLSFLFKVLYYAVFFVPAVWLIWVGNRQRAMA